MKKLLQTLLILLLTSNAGAQEAPNVQTSIDSIEATLKYQHGTIKLRNGLATLTVPKGFKYLDAAQSEYVLTELWGNPKDTDMTLGMILPENGGVLADDMYAFNIQFDEIGYVKDDDAGDIDYKELLTDLQKETEEANAERTEAGYETISLVGWAKEPFYDADRNILHWAKEIKFGTSPENTLNYNIRILGRKGVMVLNAIGTMDQLPQVEKNIASVLDIVAFEKGSKYADFNPEIDEVATWTIGSLVAGKVLAKAGFFVLILKFWKLILVGLAAAGTALKRFFGRKNTEPEVLPEPIPEKEEVVEVVS